MPDGVDELRTAPLAAEWLARDRRCTVTVSEKQRDAARRHARGAARSARGSHRRERRSGRACEIAEAPGPRAAATDLHGRTGATLAVDCAGVDSFLGMISTAIVEATLMGTWDRLKVCRSRTPAAGRSTTTPRMAAAAGARCASAARVRRRERTEPGATPRSPPPRAEPALRAAPQICFAARTPVSTAPSRNPWLLIDVCSPAKCTRPCVCSGSAAVELVLADLVEGIRPLDPRVERPVVLVRARR